MKCFVMAYDKDEIGVLRIELQKVLECLDFIASTETDQDLEDRCHSLEEENAQLKSQLSQVQADHKIATFSLSNASDQLENLVQANGRLVSENEALNHRLKELEVKTEHQADKITALRSVAKALESENDLISREKGRPVKSREEKEITERLYRRLTELETELGAKEEERRGFIQCFENLESDKQNLTLQLMEIQNNFAETISERDQLKTSLFLNSDTLDALRQSKRLVENKYQSAIETSELQARQIEELTVEKMCLQEELLQKASNLEAIQQEFELQSTMYESTISEMQGELDKRLDEMTVSKEEDTEVIRQTFAQLFDEKARELNTIETEYQKCRANLDAANRRLVESDYREQELTSLLQRKTSFEDSGKQVQEQMELISQHSAALEEQLTLLKSQYDLLEQSYLNAVAQFKAELIEAASRTYVQSPPASSPQWTRDINFNSEKTTSSKKKKNRKRNKK